MSIKIKKLEMEKIVYSAIKRTVLSKLRAYAIEDLLQEGIIVLIECLRKGYRLENSEDRSIIYTAIKNRFIDICRSEKSKSRPVLFSTLEKKPPNSLEKRREQDFLAANSFPSKKKASDTDVIHAFMKSLDDKERLVLKELTDPSPKTFGIFKRERLSQELFFKCRCGWTERWNNQENAQTNDDTLMVTIECPCCHREVILGGDIFSRKASKTWLTSSPKVNVSSIRESLGFTVHEMDVCLSSLRVKAVKYLS